MYKKIKSSSFSVNRELNAIVDTTNEFDKKKMEIIITASDLISWDYDCLTQIATIKNYGNFEKHITIEDLVMMIHPEDKFIAKNAANKLFKGENEVITMQARYNSFYEKLDENQWKYGTMCGVPFEFANDGSVTKYTGYIRDETKWHKLNFELKDYMSRMNIINKSCNIVQWNYNIESRIIYSYSEDSILTSTPFTLEKYLTYVHVDDHEKVNREFALMNKGQIKSVDCEYRLLVPGFKGYQYVVISGTMQCDNNGAVVKYIGIRQNSTKIHHLNKELEKNSSKMQLAIKNAGVDLWEFNCQLKQFTISNEYKSDSEKTVYTIEQYFNKLEYDNLDILNENIAQMTNGEVGEFGIDTKYRVRGSGDNWTHITITGVPFERENGKIISYTGFRKDNTVLVEAKLKTELANQLLETIIDRIPCMLFLKDVSDEFRYITVNKGYYLMTNNVKKEIIGRVDHDIFPKELADKLRKEDIDVSNSVGPQVSYDELEYDGVKNYFETIKEAFEFADGRKLILGLTLNITEQKRMHNEIVLAKNKAEQSDKLKSAFIANMSHEIRTPLNAIVGFSELLMQTSDYDEKREYCNIISTNNELLLRLIGDILDISKIESGLVVFKPEMFELVDYFNDLSVSMKQRVKNPDVNFISVNPYKSCVVELDKNRFAQVLTNFVTNSIKYTPKGFIKMSYEYVDNGIKISVSDSGIGITDDKHSKVFQRFEKFDDFAQGTGLGLSICKAIIEVLDGKIGFESQAGVGSTFWAWFPCNAKMSIMNNDKLIDIEMDELKGNKELKGKLRILVAEDNDSNYLLVKHLLKDYELVRALNGKEAVDLMKTESFDLVLMDMKMPIMSGIEATIAIRESNKEIPIFALTAHAFGSDMEAAFSAGCNKFLTKPVNKNNLIDAIESV